MTDPLDPLDELASAHLDGLTSVEDDARVHADAALRARVDALRAARAELRRAAEPIDEARREQAIRAALAAFDTTASDNVVALAEIAARRRSTRRARLVGVAAAIVLIAALIPIVSGVGDDDRDPADGRTAAAPFAADEEGATERATRLDSATADAESAQDADDTLAAVAPASGAIGLGRHADADALVAAVRDLLIASPSTVEASTTTAGAPPAPSPCEPSERDRAARDGLLVVLQGTAVVGERPVFVTVTEDASGQRTLTTVDPAMECAVVVSALL